MFGKIGVETFNGTEEQRLFGGLGLTTVFAPLGVGYGNINTTLTKGNGRVPTEFTSYECHHNDFEVVWHRKPPVLGVDCIRKLLLLLLEQVHVVILARLEGILRASAGDDNHVDFLMVAGTDHCQQTAGELVEYRVTFTV